ncbi:hypothetical protein [Rhizobium oryziradicis]|uniref:Uncharacterized protein n=1 Tax=Rhizobium oryziradicis TaxID=1867956 RepID=A0A1Q8ZRF6_9HYPH|nr:hypothetical protein [Rhizobium oryziradicis]OLP44664.1 hypothetical protein BJF95_09195 [Rhizobium oryziradicis]
MQFLGFINSLDKRTSWSFFGFLLAIIFGCTSLYTEFFKDQSPRLGLEVLSNEPVLDVREKLADLEVFYQSQDIAKSGKTISVLIVRVANRGSADILNNYYDSKVPLGIRVGVGTIVKADVSDASIDYLRKVAVAIKNETSVTLAPVILEKNEWYVVKIIVLHSIENTPLVSSEGKIAGQREISVSFPNEEISKNSLLYNVFSGSVLTQIIRVLFYFLAGVFLLFFILILPSEIINSYQKSRRKKQVARFKEKSKYPISQFDEFIFSAYVRRGLKEVKMLISMAQSEDYLRKFSDVWYGGWFTDETRDSLPMSESERELSSRRHNLKPREVMIFDEMRSNSFIEQKNGIWEAVPDRLNVATSFLKYIEIADGG